MTKNVSWVLRIVVSSLYPQRNWHYIHNENHRALVANSHMTQPLLLIHPEAHGTLKNHKKEQWSRGASCSKSHLQIHYSQRTGLITGSWCRSRSLLFFYCLILFQEETEHLLTLHILNSISPFYISQKNNIGQNILHIWRLELVQGFILLRC